MLPKPYRLPSKRIFPAIKQGEFFPSKSFNIRWLPTSPIRQAQGYAGADSFKVAIVIPTRLDKRTTKRNRAKRLLREAIRLLLLKIKASGEMVVLAKKNIFSVSFQELSKEIGENFKKLGLITISHLTIEQ